jgi:hypothetical protein
MKGLKRLVGFIFAFVMVMTAFCMTSFAEDIKYSDNLIPIMTSDTTPSGKASCSSVWDDKHYVFSAWKAFDKSKFLFYS